MRRCHACALIWVKVNPGYIFMVTLIFLLEISTIYAGIASGIMGGFVMPGHNRVKI